MARPRPDTACCWLPGWSRPWARRCSERWSTRAPPRSFRSGSAAGWSAWSWPAARWAPCWDPGRDLAGSAGGVAGTVPRAERGRSGRRGGHRHAGADGGTRPGAIRLGRPELAGGLLSLAPRRTNATFCWRWLTGVIRLARSCLLRSSPPLPPNPIAESPDVCRIEARPTATAPVLAGRMTLVATDSHSFDGDETSIEEVSRWW